MTWLVVAIGGALGSLARHATNRLVHERWLTSAFPMATVLINVSGCFVIGLLAGSIAAERIVMRAHMREFVFVGLLGGFTTFSTFGLDTLTLARGHSASQAGVNVALHVAGGLIAVAVGYQLGSARG